MKYKAVLFDLDGTLINTAPGIIACAKQVMLDLGIALPPEGIFHRFIGPPLPKCFEAVAGCDEATCKKAAEHYVEIFGMDHIQKFVLYDGITQLLQALKNSGIKLGVATYKQLPATYNSLDHFDLTKYFDVIAGSNPENTFTKGQIITHALQDLNAVPEQTLMIGDSMGDYTGAVENGCDFIAAAYGYGFMEVADIPGDFIANSVEEIHTYLFH